MNDKASAVMERSLILGILTLVLAAIPLVLTAASADVGTAFVYQGQLLDGDEGVKRGRNTSLDHRSTVAAISL